MVDASSPNKNSTLLMSGLNDAAALDFLYETDENGEDISTICWTDITNENIKCVRRDQLAEPREVVTSGKREQRVQTKRIDLVRQSAEPLENIFSTGFVVTNIIHKMVLLSCWEILVRGLVFRQVL